MRKILQRVTDLALSHLFILCRLPNTLNFTQYCKVYNTVKYTTPYVISVEKRVGTSLLTTCPLVLPVKQRTTIH